MNLTQKETALLKDLRDQESLCVEKYTDYAGSARDEQLKNLFSQIASAERAHLQKINDIAAGNVPAASGGTSPIAGITFRATYGSAEGENKKADCFLCKDVLSGEKHVSHLYDTCIFEFNDAALRNTLNSIQTDEQIHGKAIYDYMSANSMY